jgi:hypothetical protein
MHATAAMPIYIGHTRARIALFAGVRHKCISCSLFLAAYMCLACLPIYLYLPLSKHLTTLPLETN